MYNRQWPAGCLGYSNEARRNATILQPTISTAQSTADERQPSPWTLRRWYQRLVVRGNPDRLGPAGGRPRKLSFEGAYRLWFFKMVNPDATFEECAEWVSLTTQPPQVLSQSQWSRELQRLAVDRLQSDRWIARRGFEVQAVRHTHGCT